MKLSLFAIVGAVLLTFTPLYAVTTWNEGVSGDLSNNQAAPNAFVLVLGANSFIGSVGTGDTQDWITLNVPAGMVLNGLVNSSYVSADAQGFMGVQSGTSFVGSPFVAGSYLGYVHYGTGATNGALPPTNLVGTNLLPLMGDNVTISPGSLGFTAPLAAGNYTFLFQQLGAATAYQFDFNVSAVPEPTTLQLLLIVGGLLLAIRRARRTPQPIRLVASSKD
jgi:hypothetical protein